jgi:hypothetical protein
MTGPTDATEGRDLTVFVNGTRVTVPAGSAVLDAVARADAAAAEAIRGGTRAVTDSRGLPVAPDAPLTGGFVMRIVPVRAARAAAAGPDGGDPAPDAGGSA